MDAPNIRNLREWLPINDIFQKIPQKISKGLFFVDVNVTCIDAVDDFIALGTDVGVVFWYNRSDGQIKKFRTEVKNEENMMIQHSTTKKGITITETMTKRYHFVDLVLVSLIWMSIYTSLFCHRLIAFFFVSFALLNPFQSSSSLACIKVLSSVEHLIATGSVSGEVTAFQVQKDLPWTEIDPKIIASLVKSEPPKRFTIQNDCRAAITSIEWSKNGMKLFSGDTAGVVILTEFDFNDGICRSSEILNEAYSIVQMNFISPWLLVSTVFRAVLCSKNTSIPDDKWQTTQIGKSDRKVMNYFGATFLPSANKTLMSSMPSIVCSRPGFRFWLADVDGNVSHTFLLKDSVLDNAAYEVPLLNPRRHSLDLRQTYFGPCHYYCNSFIITYCDSIIYVINLEKLKVEATIRRLRKIQYLAVNGTEIFILEGGRSLIRLSLETNPPDVFGVMPVEHVPDDDDIIDGDECLELPPIEKIQLDTPIECEFGEHNLLREDKLLLEHSKKLAVFEKINHIEYDDDILFGKGTKRKKKLTQEKHTEGIVEIARPAEAINEANATENRSIVKISKELTNGKTTENGQSKSIESNHSERWDRVKYRIHFQCYLIHILL